MERKFVLNALVPPREGTGVLRISQASLDDARAEAARGAICAVGHPSTAALLGVQPARREVLPQPGDIAYVVRLRGRPTGDVAEVDPQDLQVLRVEYLAADLPADAPSPDGGEDEGEDGGGGVPAYTVYPRNGLVLGIDAPDGVIPVGEEGRGRRLVRVPVPDGARWDGERVVALPVQDGTAAAVVLIRDHSGFRGGWSLTHVEGPPPREVACGVRAQGMAGRMGGGPEVLLAAPAGAVMELRRTGRLYGAPGRLVLRVESGGRVSLADAEAEAASAAAAAALAGS